MLAVLALMLGFASLSIGAATPAAAAVRFPFDAVYNTQDNGAITLIGNSQMSCGVATTACLNARKGSGTDLNNNDWAMKFVDADTDSTTTNSTSADLALPDGSTVLSAWLIWGGRRLTGDGATRVALRVPGGSAYTTVTGALLDPAITATESPYQSSLDITDRVRAAGNGTYWVGNISAATGADRYAGWSMVVAYRNPVAPLRDLRIFRGFADVTTDGANSSVSIPINGFLAPPAGTVNASVGFVAWEGDKGTTGETIKLGNTTLTDATHPANNFFNSSISDAGAPITNRNPNDLNAFGVDITRVSANGILANNSTSTTVQLTTNSDFFYPGIVTTQIDLYTPAFNPVSKSVTNLSGNTTTQVGDTLEYQVTLTNTGQDVAETAVAADPLPVGLTYVPNSLVVTSNTGATTGAVTDTAGDDIGEYVAASRLVRVRGGTGATSTTGGTVAVNSTLAYRFRVTVDRSAAGSTVANTATLAYRAKQIGRDYTFVGNTVATPVATLADLAISKISNPTSQAAGNSVTYTMTAVNNGPTAASNVVLVDTLPAGVGYVSSTPPAGTTCTVSGQLVTCTAGTLANGASIAVAIVTAVAPGTAAGTVNNTARVSSDTSDDVLTNNTSNASTQISSTADLSLTKTASPSTVAAGAQVTYTLLAANGGPSTASNVVVTDPLPNGQTLVSATSSAGTCSSTAGTVSCAVGSLGPTGSASITIVARVAANSGAATVRNTATVSSSTTDPVSTNNNASANVAVATSADLGVTKTAATNPAAAGSAETYTITVANSGPSDAQAVTVTDPVVTGLTARSASSTQGTCSITSGVVSCALGALTAGGSIKVTVVADIAADQAAGPLTNAASVTSSTADPVSANNAASATVTVAPSADLVLSKTSNPSTIVFGAPVTYTLTARNNGPSQASDVTISDPLPAGLSFLSSGSGCTATAVTVSCPIGTLANGASRVVSFVASTPAGGSGTVTNTATVGASTTDPVPANNTAAAVSTTAAQADLSLTKTAPAGPTAGQAIVYSVTATNNGPSAASEVVITDTVPAGITPSTAGGPGVTCTVSGQTVSCPVGTLANGQSVTIGINGSIDPSVTGAVVNSAAVTSSTPDPTPGNNSASATSTIVASADIGVALALAVGQPSSVNAGDLVDYTVTVTNKGPSTASGVVVTGQVPPGLTPVLGSSAGLCTVTDGTVTCNLGPLSRGATVAIPLQARVNSSTPAGQVVGSAKIGSTTPDPVSTNNSSTSTLTVGTSANLALTKAVSPDPLTPGLTGRYTVVATNNGPSDAQNVVVTDTLAATLNPGVPSTSTGSCSVTGRLIRCTVPTLAAGATVSVGIPVTVASTATGSIRNSAAVTSGTADPNSADNTAAITTAVQPQADLRVVKTADAEPATAGTAVAYSILVSNVGPSVAQNVTLADPLPAGLLVVPGGVITTGGTCSANPTADTVSCSLGDLAVGVSRTIVVQALVPAIAEPGSVVTNQVTVTSPTPDPTPADRVASTTSTIAASADLSVSKAPVADPPEAGNTQDYVLSVNNAGPSVARGVVVSDPLPAGTSFVDATSSVGSCSPAGGVVSCTFGDLQPFQSPTVQITVRLDPSIAGTFLTNTATIASTPVTGAPTPDPLSANNSSTVRQPVAARSDVTLAKSITNGPIVAGSTVTYRVVANNTGPSNATNLTITDPVPGGTTLLSATASDDGSCQPGVTVTCAWPTVPVGANRSVLLVVAVPANAVVNSIISNTATVASAGLDNNPTTATATAQGPVTSSADLSAVKSVLSGSPVAGGRVRWQIAVANAGPSDAVNVVLADSPAPGVVFTGTLTGAGTCAITGGALSCSLGRIAAGSSVVVSVDGALAADFAGPSVANSATVSATTPDPNPADNTGSVVSSTTTSADLSVSKSANSASFVAGQSAGWTITVVNAGPSVAEGAVVTDLLPAGVRAAAGAVVDGGACAGAANSGGGTALSCTLPTLPVGGSARVQISGVVDASYVAPTIANNASVTATTPDPNATNNGADTSTPVGGSADLTVTKTGPATVTAGSPITWTVQVSNAGPSNAQAVVVTDQIPAAVSAVSGTGPGGDCTVGATVTCSVGVLAAGASTAITLRGTVDPAATGQLTNTASASATTTDPNTTDNSAVATTSIVEGSGVSVVKTFIGASAVPGSTVSWLLTVDNEGPSVARGVVLTDSVPAAVSGLSAVDAPNPGGSTPPVCTITGNDLRCAVDAVLPGVPVRVQVSGTLGSDYRLSTLDNTAQVSATSDIGSADNSSTAITPTSASADLRISKTLTSGRPVAGAAITYRIDATNDGPSDATGVLITDQLPAEIVSAAAVVTVGTGSCTVSGTGLIRCSVAAVPARTSVQVSVTGRVTQALGSSLSNTATVTATTPDPLSDNNSATVVGSVGESANLSLTKSGPAQVTAGSTASWQLKVVNAGPSNARDVVVTDVAPTALGAATMSIDGGATCPSLTACPIGAIPSGGAVTLTVTGTIASGNLDSSVVNRASVASPTADPDTADNSAALTSTVRTSADVALVKSVTPDPLVPGRNGSYTITATNSGPSDAQATVVADLLPPGLTVRDVPGIGSSQGSCRLLTRTVSCELGAVVSGSSATITIPVSVDADITAGSIPNSATVSSTTADPNTADNTASIDSATTPLADLTLVKNGPDRIFAGQPLSWAFSLVNSGPSVATDVVITDPVPAGVTLAGVSATRGSCVVDAGVITCTIGALGVGDVARIEAFAQGVVDPSFLGARIVNTATVSSSTPEADPGQLPDGRTATATTVVAASADVVVAKVPTAAVAVPGRAFSWNLTVRNNGPSTAGAVSLTDALPAGLTGLTFTSGGVPADCPNAVCTIGDLLPGAPNAVSYTVSGVLDPGYADATLTNTAEIDSTTPDPTPGNDDVSSTVPVAAAADLVVTKTADRDASRPAVPGEPITWTITVTNDGPSAARDVTLTDDLPDVDSVSLTPSAGSCLPDGTCALGDIAPGAAGAVVVRVTATVPADYTEPTLVNTATVSTPTADPTPADQSATLQVPVSASADLRVAKAGPPGPVDAGSPISWTITVSNDGPSDAAGGVVTDTVVDGISDLTATLADGSCDVNPDPSGGTVVRCALPTVPAGGSAVVTIDGKVDADNVAPAVDNTATVTAATSDPDRSDNQATTSTALSTSANLAISKVGPATVSAGGAISWIVEVTNSGPSDALAATITDQLPSVVGAVTASGPGGACVVDTATASCPVGAVAVGATAQVTLTGTVDPGYVGGLTNTAEVTSTTADPDSTDNTAAADSTVGQASAVTVTKVFTAGAAAVPGRPVSWRLQAIDAGPSVARDVVLTDTVPAAVGGIVVTPVGVPGDPTPADCTVTGQEVRCAIAGVAPGTPVSITVSGMLTSDFAAATLENTATVIAPADTTSDDNTATSSIPVALDADLAIGKALTQFDLDAGGPLAYRITVTDNGPSDAAGAVVSDLLPAALLDPVATITTGDGSCEIVAATLTCAFAAIAAGGQAVVDVAGSIAQGTTEISNTATVDSDTPDSQPANNSSSAQASIGANADLSITKTGPTDPVLAGGQATWTLLVANDGPSDATDVTVDDLAPAALLNATMTVADGPTCASLTDCAIGTVPADGSVVLTVTGTVDPGTLDPILVNTADVESPVAYPDGSNNVAQTNTAVTTSAALSITKALTPGTLVPGRAGSFTLTVSNAGPSNAQQTQLTDPLPDGIVVTEPISASQGRCDLIGRTVSCALGSVSGTTPVTIVVPFTVDAGTTVEELENSASVSSATPDPDLGDNTSTVSAAVTRLADLTLTKSGPGTVNAGEPLRWTFTLTNDGPSLATDVVVRDTVPDGVGIASAVSTFGSCDVDGQQITCTVGALPAAATTTVQITAAGVVDPSYTGDSIVNTAEVTSPTAEPDPDQAPDGRAATATTAVTTSADVSVVKTAVGPQATPGQRFSWNLLVRNDGPSTAREVALTDLVPAGLTAVTFTDAVGAPVNCPAAVCALGDLLPGDTASITVSGLVDPAFDATSLTNPATVSTTTPDPDLGDNASSSTVGATGSADLVVTKTADTDTATPGSEIDWTITVTNDGPSVARAVTLTDQLPELREPALTPSVGSCTPQTGCTLGDLAVGAAVTVRVSGAVPADTTDTTIVNTATAASATVDPNPDNSTATSIVAIAAAADVSIQITGPAGPLVAGTDITWTVTVVNKGPSVARQVVATTPPPTGFPVAAPAAPGTCAGLPICDLGDLAPGDTATYTVTRTIPPGYPDDLITATASVITTTADPVAANDISTTATSVVRGADLSLVKTVTPDPAVPGQPLTYTLTVANAGPSTAAGVTVLDVLPDGLIDVTAEADVGTCSLDGGAVTCRTDAVAPGAGMVVTIDATLGETAVAGTVPNTASVSSTTPDPVLGNNSDTVNPPTVGADLTVTKVADVDRAVPGGPISWTVTVTNTGPGPARAVRLADPLPIGIGDATASVTSGAGSCSPGSIVACTLGTLPSGASATVSISATVDPAHQGAVTNTATVTSVDETDAADNLAQAVTPLVAAADVGLVKTVIGDVVAGAPVTWSLLVDNAGPAAATGVTVTDQLPAGVTLTATPAGCSLGGSTLTCIIGELAALDSATVELTGTLAPAARGRVDNSATVAADQLDPDPSDNTGTTSTPISAGSDVTVTKRADTASITTGGSVTYSVVLRTGGPSTATSVEVAEQFPDGATLVSATTNKGSYDAGTSLWTVGDLNAGEPEAVLTVQLQLADPGTATNVVTADAAELDDPISASAVVEVVAAGEVPPGVPGNGSSVTPTPPGSANPPGSAIPPAAAPGEPPAPGAVSPGPGGTAPTSENGALGYTGVPADTLASWALVLTLAGAALVIGIRRRRTRG